ncbi:peroxiredoxin family protein [Gaopeijia maritima]|uniref:Redoxin domain-containing protein n=1 Tax=Gaopeijia maritima TaxID=3119007 RepID=A0ABU9EDG7_9BACT
MQAYRDQYASLFKDGRNVVLIGISSDTPEELASWAKDDDFQFLFGSDPGSAGYAAFGGDPRDNGMVGSRAVIVVAPDGTISHVMPTFNQVDPAAYDELSAAIDAVTPDPDDEGGE